MVHAVTPPPNRAELCHCRPEGHGGVAESLHWIWGRAQTLTLPRDGIFARSCKHHHQAGCVASGRRPDGCEFGGGSEWPGTGLTKPYNLVGDSAVWTALTFTQAWRANVISITAEAEACRRCWYWTLYIYSNFTPSAPLLLTMSWLELAFPVVSWKYCHPKTRRRKRGSMKSSQCHTVTRKIWGDRAQARLSKTSQQNKTCSGFKQGLMLMKSLTDGYRFYSQCFLKVTDIWNNF